MPTSNVEVRGELVPDYDVLFDMVVMDPNFEDWTDPNHLTFTPANYNVPQQICLTALDDDVRGEGPEADELEWVPGVILLNGLSDDVRYQSSEEGGELDETEVRFNVQDNECGAKGYSYTDFNGDCVVNLADFALFYEEWTLCTQPYPSDPCEVCDKLWNLIEE